MSKAREQETDAKEITAAEADPKDSPPQQCGVVMPISSNSGGSEQHWREVKTIIFEAITLAGLAPGLVSDSEDIGVIMRRIVDNIYHNPIVVVDVSANNPNCMFELGLRLAFDKPVVIVKDNLTPFSFDTGSIEHLEYPRDLRYSIIIDFKERLRAKILGTLEKSKADNNFSPFLKHYGTFTVAQLETREVSKEDFILQKLKDIEALVTQTKRHANNVASPLSTKDQYSKQSLVFIPDGPKISLEEERQNIIDFQAIVEKVREIYLEAQKDTETFQKVISDKDFRLSYFKSKLRGTGWADKVGSQKIIVAISRAGEPFGAQPLYNLIDNNTDDWC